MILIWARIAFPNLGKFYLNYPKSGSCEVQSALAALYELGRTIGRDEKLMIVDKFFRTNRLTS